LFRFWIHPSKRKEINVQYHGEDELKNFKAIHAMKGGVPKALKKVIKEVYDLNEKKTV